MILKEMETKAKLAKPCPFCGSRKIKTLSRSFYEAKDMNGATKMECESCGATLWCFHDGDLSDTVDYNDITRKAIMQWNRRAS